MPISLLGIDLYTLSSQFKEFMPFCDTYMAAFKNDIEYSQLVLHTAAILQSNKFIQVIKLCICEMGYWLHKGNKRP